MITYNIECPAHLLRAANDYLVARRVIPSGTWAKWKNGTLVFRADSHRPASIKHLCMFLDQECAAYQDDSTLQRGFMGPAPWAAIKWDPAKFVTLTQSTPPAPSPKGSLDAVMVIPFGNDTPVRYCLWDTDTGMYIAGSLGNPITGTRPQCEEYLRTLRLAGFLSSDIARWTTKRPTSA